MRTCDVLYKETCWQPLYPCAVHTKHSVIKSLSLSYYAKQSRCLNTCSRGQGKRFCLRGRRQRCWSRWKWSGRLNGQPASKGLRSVVSEDKNIMASSSHSEDSGKNVFRLFFEGASNVFRADELGVEISVIAFPALLALAADPLASLVDTAFIGRLGSVELAAVGVSIAVFNLVSKLLNFPVLSITTSFVAEEATDSGNAVELEAVAKSNDSSDDAEEAMDLGNAVDIETGAKSSDASDDSEKESLMGLAKKEIVKDEFNSSEKRVLPAVSTALVVGSALGFLEFIVMTVGSGKILDLMGVPANSDMRAPAEQYLALRAIGAPAVVLSLAVQGVFRGFKDTKTPLYATVSGNVLNIILVPILMFYLNYGVSGAAIATVISQYFIAFVLLFRMSRKVVLLPPNLCDLDFSRFLKNGSLLLARSTSVMLSMTLATSLTARLGATPMAAHQICMQVWLATSLLSDAIALAGQAIIASAIAKGDYNLAKAAAFRTLQMGCVFGVLLSLLLGLGLSTFSRIFTTDQQVLKFLALGIPFVAATQPINSLAFCFDGLHFGILDFVYAAQSMILIAILASVFMLVAAPYWGFVGIWTGLTILMTLRMFAGFLRVGMGSGPWKFLK